MVTRASRRQFRQGPPPSEEGVRTQLAGYGPAAELALDTETRNKTTEANENEAKISMYDLVDGTWTMPINEVAARNFHLNKVVYICSACHWSSTWPNQFESHRKQAEMGSRLHAKAEVISAMAANGAAFRCTGCNSAFSVPSRAQMHIESARRQNSGHENATLILSRRFALEPPVSLAGMQVPVSVAVASQSERTEVPHKRKRRHHRRVRSAHVS